MKKQTKTRKGKPKAGFTLVELMIVIVIMVILAAAAAPVFTGYVERAHRAKYYEEMHSVITATEVTVQQMRSETDEEISVIYSLGGPVGSEADNQRFSDLISNLLSAEIRNKTDLTVNLGITEISLYFEAGNPFCDSLKYSSETGEIEYVPFTSRP